jgi:endonuclease YncB( thermonuclease family)
MFLGRPAHGIRPRVARGPIQGDAAHCAVTHARFPMEKLMRLLLALAALLLCAPAYANGHMTAAPKFKRAFACAPANISVTDGDTIKCKGVAYRALGYDTPELHIACERDRALAAKVYLENLVKSGRVLIRVATNRHDRYGRQIASILIGNRDAAAIMIGQGLAHPYDGGKRAPWC